MIRKVSPLKKSVSCDNYPSALKCIQGIAQYANERGISLKNQKRFYLAAGILAIFVLWTVLISLVDRQAIGPEGSVVGFAALNRFFHQLTGVHMTLYTITDWLGLVPLAMIFGFTILGLIQWIKRRAIKKVDKNILILGLFYIVVLGIFLLFEEMVINYRPILIEGILEASYPSSTTMLVLCIIPTTIMQFRKYIKSKVLYGFLALFLSLFVAFMLIGRLLSGVHWLTDIISGIILSTGLVLMYDSIV